LVVICHSGIYRGDGVCVLPKFEFHQCLSAIQRFRISTLYLVRSLTSQLLRRCVLMSPGASDHHLDDEEQGHAGQIRSKQRQSYLYWCRATRKGNSRGFAGHFSDVGSSTRLWCVLFSRSVSALTSTLNVPSEYR
jgi:hypothetical protein